MFRLSELEFADNLEEISPNPPPRRHKLKGMECVWGLDLSRNYRLLVQSDGENDPSKVKEITIISVEDYH